MSRTVDLPMEDWAIRYAVLRSALPPGFQVWVFGSRASGRARRYSDLDLAIEGAAPLDTAAIARLRDALSASDLTIKVDVVDLGIVDAAFRRRIQNDLIRLPACPGPD